MFEILSGFPDDVLAVSAKGTITAEDYEKTMVPAVEARMKTHRPLKVFFHLGPDFEGMKMGAMVEDARLGFAHWRDWGRIAVVTDAAGIRDLAGLFRMFLRDPVKVYFNADYDKARAWISSDAAKAA
jgi:hypothetical protein